MYTQPPHRSRCTAKEFLAKKNSGAVRQYAQHLVAKLALLKTGACDSSRPFCWALACHTSASVELLATVVLVSEPSGWSTEGIFQGQVKISVKASDASWQGTWRLVYGPPNVSPWLKEFTIYRTDVFSEDAAKKLDFVETVRLTLGGGELILDNEEYLHRHGRSGQHLMFERTDDDFEFDDENVFVRQLPCFQATFPSTGELEQQFTFLEMFSGILGEQRGVGQHLCCAGRCRHGPLVLRCTTCSGVGLAWCKAMQTAFSCRTEGCLCS
ncbi:hypothetical protein AK812_SmicGene42806 [Symbiodinium microadriaticum]|uniref:Uncharacterized protein n=1 Tax=Symbiodinium microadriaticum TaxID=2951 RepID=A0A1Q9C2L7_SYMMI|nr:hypothetical protein AK812_SmicGene42806 [Symbiodinium microadriaticum]